MPSLHLDARTLQAIGAITGALLVGLSGGNTAADFIWPSVSEPVHQATRDAFASALIYQQEELELQREESERLRSELEQCHGGGER